MRSIKATAIEDHCYPTVFSALVTNDEKDAKVVLESEQGEESHGSGAELLHCLVRWSCGQLEA